MSVTGRARSLTGKGLKIQRRVAVVQMLFWPSVAVTAMGAVGAGLLLLARRRDLTPGAATVTG